MGTGERKADLALASGCVRGDPSALRQFEATVLSRVPQFLARLDASAALCDDVAQELRAELLIAAGGKPPGLAGYTGRGELKAWVRVVAIRTALRLRKSERRAPPDDGDPLLGKGDPELDYLKLRYRSVCEEAFRGALATLSSRERLYLRLHYLEGLSLDRMASLYRVNRATIARRLAAHREKLHEQTRARLREVLKLRDSEFESLLGLLRSQLAVSLQGALARDTPAVAGKEDLRAALEAGIAQSLDAGDVRAAVAQIVRGYGPEILGYLAAVLKSESDGDDAFGLFCEELLGGLDRFERRCSARTWAYRVAWHCAQKFAEDPHRRRGRRLATGEISGLAAGVRSNSQPYLKESARIWLLRVRESLSPEEQTLLVLRIDRELSWREVAVVMGEEIEEAALRKRFDRLKRKLQQAASERKAGE